MSRDALAYDGRQSYTPTPGAPKPRNFDALTAAYESGDPDAIRREIDIYADQLREEGGAW